MTANFIRQVTETLWDNIYMKYNGLKVQLNLTCPYQGEKYLILSFPQGDAFALPLG